MESWPIVVFGWPSAILGIALLVLGIVWRHPWVSAAGALASAGFCSYVALNPFPARLFGLAALACNILSVVAVRREATWPAAVLLLPFLLIIVWLAHAVLSQ